MIFEDPKHPERYIELTMVHSTAKDHLHNPQVCNYSQGLEQTFLKTLPVPGTGLQAALSRITVMETQQVFYQLSWYQWGPRDSQATFWTWIPVAISWNLFYQQTPKWHYFNLIYVDKQKSIAESEAEETLAAFASLLQTTLAKPKRDS